MWNHVKCGLIRIGTSALLPWVVVLGWFGVLYGAPPSQWFSINKLYVYDAVPGEVPKVAVSHTVTRDFLAHWNMVLYQVVDNGRFEAVCRAAGSEQRGPKRQSPDKTTLSWWFDGDPCIRSLKPGKYYVEEDVTWDVLSVPLLTKGVTAESNVFEVGAKERE